jgi:hypothetical protein
MASFDEPAVIWQRIRQPQKKCDNIITDQPRTQPGYHARARRSLVVVHGEIKKKVSVAPFEGDPRVLAQGGGGGGGGHVAAFDQKPKKGKCVL